MQTGMSNGRGWLGMALGAALLAGCGAGPAPQATPSLPSASTASTPAAMQIQTSYAITRTVAAHKWERIERLTSASAQFPEERMLHNGRQLDPEIVEAFGTATPPSRDALLHYTAGWDKGSGVPVLLVHGVIHEATSSWIAPHGQEGLAPTLARQGLRVFAITFAHRHGDVLLRAEQLANAIDRVKAVTGARQVDVVAHSQGTVAARALASGLRLPWMSAYRRDIRRMVLVGGPHLGIDYAFRHPVINLGLYPEQDDALRNAPMSWTRTLVGGVWVDTSDHTMFRDAGNNFPCQAQLLYRWDQEYPLPATEPDWYTTYHGGQGFVSYSPGIDSAIAQGGNFMEQLRQRPLDPGVQLAVLAGNQATLTTALNETSGPSDGVVFVKSATATADMTRGGAPLLAKAVLPLNHMELIYAPQAKAWILDALRRS